MTRRTSSPRARVLFPAGAALTGAFAGSAYVFLVLLPTLLDAGGGRLPDNWHESQIWVVAVVAILAGAVFGLLCAIFALVCGYLARKLYDTQWVETVGRIAGVLLSTSALYFAIFAGFKQLGLTVIVAVAAAVGIVASLLLHRAAARLQT